MNPSERDIELNVDYSSTAVAKYVLGIAKEVFPEYDVSRYVSWVLIKEVSTFQKEVGIIFKKLATFQEKIEVIRIDVCADDINASIHREELYSRLEPLLKKVGRKCKRVINIVKYYVEED